MKRITVDEVKKAYDETGLKVKHQGFFRYNRDFTKPVAACALGAIAVSKGYDPIQGDTAIGLLVDEGYDHTYLVAFMDGFDGLSMIIDKEGYADGMAAWEAVKENVYE